MHTNLHVSSMHKPPVLANLFKKKKEFQVPGKLCCVKKEKKSSRRNEVYLPRLNQHTAVWIIPLDVNNNFVVGGLDYLLATSRVKLEQLSNGH